MNTRRKFLLQGTMATTALIVTKPFNAVARTLSPVTGFSDNNNKVIFLHTGNQNYNYQHHTIKQINLLKKNTGNLLLLHAGNITDSPDTQLKYDITMPADITTDDYRILYKGNIKIGIINAVAGEKDTVKRINTVSAWLKKEKRCQIVACLSQLGYKNKTSLDDRQLALESSNLDIIMGGHPSNICDRTTIMRNSKKEEVIINSVAGKTIDFGNIEIGFDENGKKNFIAINNLRKPTAANN